MKVPEKVPHPVDRTGNTRKSTSCYQDNTSLTSNEVLDEFLKVLFGFLSKSCYWGVSLVPGGSGPVRQGYDIVYHLHT